MLRSRPGLSDDCHNFETKEHKAIAVEKAALYFREMLRKTVMGGDSTWTYYMHCLVHHVPDQIRLLPVDIMDSSAIGIEHSNQIAKNAFKSAYLT